METSGTRHRMHDNSWSWQLSMCRLNGKLVILRIPSLSRINSLKVARAAAHAAQHRGSQGRASQWTKVNGTARSIETLAEEARKKDEQVAAARQALPGMQKKRQGLEEQRAALATLKVANGALVESARETASKHTQVRLGDFMMLEGSTFVTSTESFQGSAIEQRRLQNESGAAGLRAAETALRDLQAKCEEKRQILSYLGNTHQARGGFRVFKLQNSRQETQALQAAYRRQVEEMQEVEASLWAVRSRLDAASLELEEEQGHNLRLGEVIASEASSLSAAVGACYAGITAHASPRVDLRQREERLKPSVLSKKSLLGQYLPPLNPVRFLSLSASALGQASLDW
eukprot:s1436_g3.t1